MERKSNSLLIFLCVALASTYAFFLFSPFFHEQPLTITMLDIGQGDAIHIRTPNGQDILIDGGPDRKVLYELGQVMPPWDSTIEWVIASHPDADHIAGLAELPDNYTIEHVIRNGRPKATGFAKALDQWPQKYGVEELHAYRGWVLEIEPDVTLEFVHPVDGKYEKHINDDSVMFYLHHKGKTIFFTGDAATHIEEAVVEEFPYDIDILKVGHHGSKTSTSQEALKIWKPEIALMSVGEGNKFNHPHEGSVASLQKIGAEIFRTDLQGRIECIISEAITCTHQ